jgi:pimeloyl-ACP methyl ester carboxylesterase
MQEAVDRIPVDDVLAAIAWLGQRHKFDPRRWATMGEGFGGYLALRATQLHPEVFRCAIAIDAPLDLEAWLRPPLREIEAGPQMDFTQEVHRAFFRRGATSLADTSVLRSAAKLTKPVFLIVNAQRRDEITLENSRLRSELKRLGRAPDYLEVQEDYALRLPMARARAFRKIEEFFNLNLYDYKVNVGEVKELK